MREFETWRTDLSPPAGGLGRLRERVGRAGVSRESRHWYRWSIGAVAALLLLGVGGELALRARATDAWVKVLSGGVPRRDLLVAHGAALALPSDHPDVTIYLVYGEPPSPVPSTSQDGG